MKQESLFETEATAEFSDKRLNDTEKPRLNRQCVEILQALFRKTKMSNAELNVIAFRYSARIYDIKRATGIVIEIVERNHETGVNWYAFSTDGDKVLASAYVDN